MGFVWEAYHKGVPLLGVPENPTDIGMVNYVTFQGVVLYVTSNDRG